MTTITKRIGLKEFRANIASLWREAQKKNISYIILNHSKPIFRLDPLFKEAEIFEYLAVPNKTKKNEPVLPEETAELYSDRQIQEWVKSDKLDKRTAQKIKRLLA